MNLPQFPRARRSSLLSFILLAMIGLNSLAQFGSITIPKFPTITSLGPIHDVCVEEDGFLVAVGQPSYDIINQTWTPTIASSPLFSVPSGLYYSSSPNGGTIVYQGPPVQSSPFELWFDPAVAGIGTHTYWFKVGTNLYYFQIRVTRYPSCGYPTTQLESSYCNITELSPLEAIDLEEVIDATSYEIELKNLISGQEVIYTSTQNRFAIGQTIMSTQPDDWINVRARVNFPDGHVGEWGQNCQVHIQGQDAPDKQPSNTINSPIQTANGRWVVPPVMIYDRFGNVYTKQEVTRSSDRVGETCTAGIFHLTFQDDNMGFADASPGTWLPTLGEERRACVCKAFADLSELIVANTNPYDGTLPVVEIDVSSLGTGAPANALGSASSLYVLTNLLTDGYVDGEVWKTINSGIDSYTDLAIAQGGFSGPFYHGVMEINFNNPSTVQWHTDFSQAVTDPNLFDLYSVALHEAIHALGFASLIEANGQSVLGYDLFSRFDSFLKTSSGQSLINNTSGCYDADFSALISNLISGCGTPILFDGTGPSNANHPVYTPTSFQQGSSLSHFNCDGGAGCPASYMTNGYAMNYCRDSGPGWEQRTPNEATVQTLCDLGYSISGVYGDPSTPLSHENYNVSCPNNWVAGVNDMRDQNGFHYVVEMGSSITIDNILDNDENAVSFSCLEPVFTWYGTISNQTSTSFTFTPGTHPTLLSAPFYHPIKLRYIPIGANGEKGNVTFIFIYPIHPDNSNCDPQTCNYVCDGSFEQVQNPSVSPYSAFHMIPQSVNGFGGHSPDLFSNGAFFNSTINQYTYCWAAGNVAIPVAQDGNNHIGLYCTNNGTPNDYSEAVNMSLHTTMVPGKKYSISFWVHTLDVANSCASTVQLTGSEFPPCELGVFNDITPGVITNCSGYDFAPELITIHNPTGNASWTKVVVNGFSPQNDMNFLQLKSLLYPPGTNYLYIDNLEVYEELVDIPTDTLEVCDGNSAVIQTETDYAGTLSYSWTPNNGTLDDVNAASPQVTPNMDQEYFVTVTSDIGCQWTDSVEVIVTPPCCTDPAFNQQFPFAPTSIGRTQGHDIATDNNDNIYIAGYYHMDLNLGGHNLPNNNNGTSFLAKINGDCAEWLVAKPTLGMSIPLPRDIQVKVASNGRVFFMANDGVVAPFISEIDPLTGSDLWTYTLPNTINTITDMVLDETANEILFTGTLNTSMTIGMSSLPNPSSTASDVYLARLGFNGIAMDAASIDLGTDERGGQLTLSISALEVYATCTDGAAIKVFGVQNSPTFPVQWDVPITSVAGTVTSSDMEVGPNGTILIGGMYTGTAFGVPATNEDVFVAELSTNNGSMLSSANHGVTDYLPYMTLNSGNICIVKGIIPDLEVRKIDANNLGSTIWTATGTGTGGFSPWSLPASIMSSNSGTIYVTGAFLRDLNLGNYTITANSNGGGTTMYAAKLDGNGNFQNLVAQLDPMENQPQSANLNDSPNTSGVRVYPNPTNNTLMVKATNDLSTIRLLDPSGRVVIQRSVHGDHIILDLQDLAIGTYTLVTMGKDGRVQHTRILKN